MIFDPKYPTTLDMFHNPSWFKISNTTSKKIYLFEYMGFALKMDKYFAILEKKYQNRYQQAW